MRTYTVSCRVPATALAVAALLALTGFAAFPLALAGAQDSVAELEGKLQTLRTYKDQQQANIRKMNEALNSDWPPDPGELWQFATAGGQRTAAYHAAPPYIQMRIDEVEASYGMNARQGGTLGAAAAQGGTLSLAFVREVYKAEIERSQKFVALLEGDERQVAAALETARQARNRAAARGDANAFTARRQEENLARLEEIVATITKDIEELEGLTAQMAAAHNGLKALLPHAVERAARAVALLTKLLGSDAEIQKAVQRCKDAAVIRARIEARAAEAEKGEKAVTTGLDGAEAMVVGCKTREDAVKIKKLYDAAEGLTPRVGLQAKKAAEDNEALKKALAEAAAGNEAAKETGRIARDLRALMADATVNEKARAAARRVEQLKGTLATRKVEIGVQITQFRYALPPADSTVDQRFQQLRARLEATAVPPAENSGLLLARIQGESQSAQKTAEQALALTGSIPAPPLCAQVTLADEAVGRAEAAYDGALVWLGAAANIPQKAAACLARSQPPLPVSTGLPRPAPADPGKNVPPLPVSVGVTPPPAPVVPNAMGGTPPPPAAAPGPPPVPVSYGVPPPPRPPRGPEVPGFEDLPLVPAVPRAPLPVAPPPAAPPRGGAPEPVAPLAARILGPTAPVEVNQTVILRPEVRGGRPPYRYRWEVAGKTVDDPEARLIPRTPGARTMHLTVWDRDGRPAGATFAVTVRDSQAVARAERDRQAAEQARLAEERRRAELRRRQQAEAARLQREKELRELRGSLERWRKDLACLEEGKRKYPRMELSCHGNFLLGSRDGAIEKLRRWIREGEQRLASAR